MLQLNVLRSLVLLGSTVVAYADDVPAPPAPEPITLQEVPLPPLAPSNTTGACSAAINPSGTGCLANGVFNTFQSGDFLPDGKHVMAQVTYQGAPASPDPASIYAGQQIIIIKIDGSTFSNGDAWKCVTCGVPAVNAQGVASAQLDYPQAFKDGKRLLIGHNILDCGESLVTSDDCTPATTFIYPIRWNTAVDGSGAGGAMRELRIHPDQVHLVFSSFTMSNILIGEGLGQFGYFARIVFNPSPTNGAPLAPRYDVVNVTRLYRDDAPFPLSFSDNEISYDPDVNFVGETRGFNGDGSEVTFIGYSVESSNIDVFAANLATGAVRRVTSHPEYCDPLAFSPDNKWSVVMDTRGSGRQMFIAGMRGIPPIVDLVATTFTSSTRNNGFRRFFQPYLLDFYGDRGDYFGQKINGDNNGVLGSGDINDPQWNGMADPRWSPDSTQVVFWQAQTISPDCGGENPLPCFNSTEPYGRNYRAYVATFISREPTTPIQVSEHSDTISWGTPYVPGLADPPSRKPEAGEYTLTGKSAGDARVNITWLALPQVGTVSVLYNNYSDDGLSFLNGEESVTLTQNTLTSVTVDWYSDITQSGAVTGTKKSSEDGYHGTLDVLVNVLNSTGSLITTLDGVEWKNPESGT